MNSYYKNISWEGFQMIIIQFPKFLDIKIHKSGVSQLNTIRFINLLDAGMFTINIPTHNKTEIMVLVHLYPGKIVGKLVFKNDVFAKISLANFINILYECFITVLILILFPFIWLWV